MKKIKIHIKTNKKYIESLTVDGHANKIACSAVSILVRTFVDLLSKTIDIQFDYNVSDGFVSVSNIVYTDQNYFALVYWSEFIICGFRNIKQEYEKEIEIDIE